VLVPSKILHVDFDKAARDPAELKSTMESLDVMMREASWENVTIEQVRQRLADLDKQPERKPFDKHSLDLAKQVASGWITLSDKSEERRLLTGLLEHMEKQSA